MNIGSWNVNGFRAVVKKGFFEIVENQGFDVLALQEIKAQEDQVAELFFGRDYYVYSNHAVKKGYSGVSIISKKEPIRIIKGMGIEEHDQEGRVLAAEFDDYFVVSVYVPNSKHDLVRLDYREEWDKAFLNFLKELEKEKPVIALGDFNVCHQEIDIARPKANYNKTPGYTQREIDGMTAFIQNGLIDSFRTLHPEEVVYSWWSYRGGAREKNVGWRLDYCLVSESLMPKIKESYILTEVMGSDHCPVGVVL